MAPSGLSASAVRTLSPDRVCSTALQPYSSPAGVPAARQFFPSLPEDRRAPRAFSPNPTTSPLAAASTALTALPTPCTADTPRTARARPRAAPHGFAPAVATLTTVPAT